jgi:aspartate aminotransferase
MYDQVYWTLTLEGRRHVHPVQVRPAMAPYTIYIDGASKSLAATGIRVGWVVAPEDLAGPMSALIGHIGAWAPKAEQGAVAEFLENAGAYSAFRDDMVARVRERLDALYAGLTQLRDEGLPVNVIAPEGTIYLSVQFALQGRTTSDGTRLDGDEAVRAYLLRAAGLAVVPLRAFGSEEDTGWFRLSVGAVSPGEIERVMPRVRGALRRC